MSKTDRKKIKLAPDDLVVGLYIDLELGWSDHPFTFSKFKIKNNKDLKAVQSLKIKQVTVIPAKGDVPVPKPAEKILNSVSTSMPDQDLEVDELWQEKNTQQEKARLLREKRKKLTREYQQRAKKIRNMTKDMKNRPANAIHNIDEIIDDMASIFEAGEDMMTNLVNLGSGIHDDCNHTTNVAMLSLMLGAAEGISAEELKLLGTGALLHDIGKINVPGSIKIKKTALTPNEEKIMEKHALDGRQLIERVRHMDQKVLDIIDKHHEFLDGSGYPHGLKAAKIPILVRIVAIVNLYDNLCNPADPSTAATPKIALATLYKMYQDKLDNNLVKRLIGLLGIYPPGTVVKLSDESLGLVISADPKASLQPTVLIYDPDTPKEEAMIISLTEFPDLKIEQALRPGDYPPSIHHYLGIQERLGYMVEKNQS